MDLAAHEVGGKEIHVAVPIDVAGEDLSSRHRPTVVTGEPPAKSARPWMVRFSYQAILSSACEAESTSSVAVAVHVRREDRQGTVGRGGDHLLRPPKLARARPSVLVPGDLVVVRRRPRGRPGRRRRPRPPRRPTGRRPPRWRSPAGRRSVARSPCRRSRTRRSCRRTARPRARPGRRRRPRPPRRPSGRRRPPWRSPAGRRSCPRPSVVLVPGDLVVVARGREHVQVAVAVHVRREDRVGAVGRGGDHLLGAEAARAVRRSRTRRSCRRATEAERTSRSPSPSTSAAKTDRAPSAAVEITCCASEAAPRPCRAFSYQAILSSNGEAERTSRSPSPSTSAAKTERAPSAAVEITCCASAATAAPRARPSVLVPGDLVVEVARPTGHPDRRRRPRPPRRPT